VARCGSRDEIACLAGRSGLSDLGVLAKRDAWLGGILDGWPGGSGGLTSAGRRAGWRPG